VRRRSWMPTWMPTFPTSDAIVLAGRLTSQPQQAAEATAAAGASSRLDRLNDLLGRAFGESARRAAEAKRRQL